MWASSVHRALWSVALVAVLTVSGCGSPAFDFEDTTAADPNRLPNDQELKALLDDVLDFNQQRYMNTVDHGAWQILHGVLAYGYDTYCYHDGQLVGVMQFGLDGGPIDGFTFRPGTHGLDSILEPGSKRGQGHDDQWLAVMAAANVPLDATIVVDGQKYTIKDLVTEAQWGLYEGAEASWTLAALNKYLINTVEDYDKTWKARDGEDWSVARIVEMEAGFELNQSACGGTHRLMALTNALNKYRSLGGRMEGGWLLAQQKVESSVQRFRELQNQQDGSFSTNYMIRPGITTDIARRINTTGHTVEFIVQALPQERLREPWVVRGVVTLCQMLQLTENLAVECGSLYHALHGLVIYRERLFGKRDRFTPPEVSANPAPSPPGGPAPALPADNDGDAAPRSDRSGSTPQDSPPKIDAPKDGPQESASPPPPNPAAPGPPTGGDSSPAPGGAPSPPSSDPAPPPGQDS